MRSFGKERNSREAYGWGLLAFTIANMGVGLVLIALAKDTDFGRSERDMEYNSLAPREGEEAPVKPFT